MLTKLLSLQSHAQRGYVTKADECVLEGRGEKEEESMCKGHFGSSSIALTQNTTVSKGQGFEGPIEFALKKKQLMR